MNPQQSRCSILCTSLFQSFRVVTSTEATAKELPTVLCTGECQARGGPCPHCEASLFVQSRGGRRPESRTKSLRRKAVMLRNPGGLAVGITAIFLFTMGLIAVILTTVGRRRQQKKEERVEEGQMSLRSTRVTSKPPQLPKFETKTSLSMSSGPYSPKSPESPRTSGIRFTITTPSYRSRDSGSIDSIPNVETILERLEQEADASEEHVKDGEEDVMLPDAVLGEPGPSVPSGEPSVRSSAEH